MPYLRLETTARVPEAARGDLAAALSRLCAEAIGKPEAYVMVSILDGATMSHAGAAGPTAFVDVRSIGGLKPAVNRALAKSVCQLLADRLAVPGERVYLNFTELSASAWGHDGATFG